MSGEGATAVPRSGRIVAVLLAVVVLGVVVGALAGVGWRLLVGPVSSVGDEVETQAGVDGALALATAVTGLLLALVLVLRPRDHPALRLLALLLVGAVAGPVASVTGQQLGAPEPAAQQVALLAPLVTAVVALVVSSFQALLGTDPGPPPAAPGWGGGPPPGASAPGDGRGDRPGEPDQIPR